MKIINSTEILVGIILVSVLFQFFAAARALGLMNITSHKNYWIIISLGLILMTVRRFYSLYQTLVFGNVGSIPFEVIGLVLSFCFWVGLKGIRTMFLERIASETKLQRVIEEKKVLIREVHHRIKNHMQTLHLMIGMQLEEMVSEDARIYGQELQGKLDAMMVLYDKLYRSNSLEISNAQDFITVLSNEILGIFPKTGTVELRTAPGEYPLSPEHGFSLGLLINELITNSMKYGGESVHISMDLCKVGKSYGLTYEDSGPGIPKDIDPLKSDSYGMTVIQSLVEQLHGRANIQSHQPLIWKFVFDCSLP